MQGKIDQLAFYCATDEQEDFIKSIFGLHPMPKVEDIVTSTTKVIRPGGTIEEGHNVARLKFWYEKGIEFEILRYLEGPQWHNVYNHGKNVAFLSHYGVHLDDDQPMPDLDRDLEVTLVQENFTLSHTCSFINEASSPGYGRRYHYRIYQMPDGSFLKLIKRIHRS